MTLRFAALTGLGGMVMQRASRTTLSALLTTMALVSWQSAPSYAQDADDKTQEERIQQLEAQVADHPLVHLHGLPRLGEVVGEVGGIE